MTADTEEYSTVFAQICFCQSGIQQIIHPVHHPSQELSAYRRSSDTFHRALRTAIQLVEDLAILDEQHTLRRAGRLHTVRYHNNHSGLLVDLPNSFMRPSAAWESSAPEGSSARTSSGLVISARAQRLHAASVRGHLIWVFIEIW